jgi:hypothetical protein
MKNEPAQKLEIKDFSPAVGRRPLTLRRAFGTTRWRPVVSLHQLRIARKKSYLSGEALWYQHAILRRVAGDTLESLKRCEVQRENEDALVEQRNRIRRSSSAKQTNQYAALAR